MTVNDSGFYQVTKLLLIETSNRYRPVPKRTYNLNVSHGTLSRLNNILGRGDKQVTDNELAVCVPEMVSLSNIHSGVAEIPNGWDTTRLRFLMEFVHDTGAGVMHITYLQGFTDYYEASHKGFLDPNMRFHINSIVNVTRTMPISQNGVVGQPHSRVSSMYNVISDVMGRTRYEEVQNPESMIKLCRPTDIASNLFAIELSKPSGADGGMAYTVMNNMTDTITEYKPATSDRKNANPYKYMASTLNAFTSTKSSADIGHNYSDVIGSVVNVAREPDISMCLFIDKLIQLRDYVSQSPSNFTLAELDMVSPGTTQTRTRLISRGASDYAANVNTMLSAEDTADLLQPNVEITKSAAVANSLTSIMLENLITRVGFSSTNMLGQPEVIITDINSFMDGIEVAHFVERVKTGILNTIIPNVSDGNLSTYELFVTADLLGDITVGIKLNSNPEMVMRYPAFADSLFTPVIGNVGSSQVLINDFQSLIDNSVLASF